jgi:hypothetical protein
MLCSFTMLRIEAKDLLRCSSGQPNIQAVLDTYGCSGADPSASRKPYRNTLLFAWLAQDGTSRGEMDR